MHKLNFPLPLWAVALEALTHPKKTTPSLATKQLRKEQQRSPLHKVITGLLTFIVFGCLMVQTAKPQSCVPPPVGMVGWWPGDGNANDISSNGQNGSVEGGTTFSQGEVNQAFNFDGITGRIKVDDFPALHFGTGDLTLDAWIKAPPAASYRTLFGKEEQFLYPYPSITFRLNTEGKLEFAVRGRRAGILY